ncbi:hypothetical protein ACFL1E_01010 [Candidatus Omnitrophota bacterium]
MTPKVLVRGCCTPNVNERILKNPVLFLIFLALMLATASYAQEQQTIDYEAIQQQAADIDYSDGINKQEAVLLAQNVFIEQGNAEDFFLSDPIVTKETVEVLYETQQGSARKQVEVWAVGFTSRFAAKGTALLPSFGVDIDTATGEFVVRMQ